MADRSLQATPEGIEQAKVALKGMRLNRTTLRQRLTLSRQPVDNFFKGKNVSNDIFVQICEVLNLDWQVVAGIAGTTPEVVASQREGEQVDIQALVQQTREAVRPYIQKQCGTMRVLDMEQPIELTGDRGIYTNVNILERVLGRRRLGLDDLLRDCDLEEFDRFGLSQVTEKRVPGRDAVLKYRNLLVLGKPGAGKTTFLKYLAMQCLAGDLFADRVPIFVTLKAFAESPERSDLIRYIAQETVGQYAQVILQAGRGLVLLDGLDEVREEDTKQVLAQIQALVQRLGENAVVVTCRIAAKDYSLETFTEVEVADFDDAQIETFVGNWFRAKEDAARADLMVEKLQENEPVKELASSPLLLTLLCLIFEDAVDFPANRAELYKEGIDLLLKKWDGKRKIQREQVYEKLSLKRKEDLLSSIALTAFQRKEYFLKRRVLENYISDYIGNLPDAKDDPEALHLDSEAVLRSIEAQHGLLVERASGIYSFSHLTFQEYFAAREIAESRDNTVRQKLVEQMLEKRWREVLFLTVEMLRSADELLLAMKVKIDGMVAGDEKIQRFLQWVNEKAQSMKAPYKPAAIRAYYFALALARDLDRALALALDLDLALDRSDSDLKLQLQQLSGQFSAAKQNLNNFKQWWKTNGSQWTEELRQVMINHRNIGHDWQFTASQKQLLQQYYDANLLLVQCLNSDCYVSRSVRQEIEETLLIPLNPPSKGGL
ncbi:NACHT domain-containing protein [Alkalinema pantanalense CENA528]|uniref:NACHT domain-containing protein n=1 Tax=Alkalinema pantanalense TaxID=1620705 RepID=UPI003D6F5670